MIQPAVQIRIHKSAYLAAVLRCNQQKKVTVKQLGFIVCSILECTLLKWLLPGFVEIVTLNNIAAFNFTIVCLLARQIEFIGRARHWPGLFHLGRDIRCRCLFSCQQFF